MVDHTTDAQLAEAVALSERQLAAHVESMRLMREAYGYSAMCWTEPERTKFGTTRLRHDTEYDRWLTLKQEQCRRKKEEATA